VIDVNASEVAADVNAVLDRLASTIAQS